MVKKNEEIDIQSQILLRELEEEHRREQYAKLVKAYAPYAVTAALLIVVGVGGFKWYQSYAASRAAALGAEYEQALRLAEEGGTEAARKAFAEIANGEARGYATLASLQVAAQDLKAGRKAEAVKLFDAVADDSGADVVFRDFARLQAAAVRSAEADWTEMQNRLNDLVKDGNPWRFNARELWGVAALKAGRLEDARKSFEQLLADRSVPPSIGQRAQILMGQIVAAELAQVKASGPSKGPETKKE